MRDGPPQLCLVDVRLSLSWRFALLFSIHLGNLLRSLFFFCLAILLCSGFGLKYNVVALQPLSSSLQKYVMEAKSLPTRRSSSSNSPPLPMTGDEAAEVALPKAWRTLEQLTAQVTSPGYARGDTLAKSDADGTQARAAIVVLYHFFSTPLTKRRRRTEPSDSLRQISKVGNATQTPGAARVNREVRAPACCSPALRRAVHAALDKVRLSMGNVETAINRDAVVILYVSFKPAVNAARRTSPAHSIVTPARTCPIYAWHITGLCICEPVERVYRAATSATASPVRNQDDSPTPLRHEGTAAVQATHVGDVWCSGTTFCGIKLFWVSAERRGGGVAYAVVEAARRSVCYGYEVPAVHVAFSEPTWLGSRFARRYQQRDDFLVY
jgi:hypothetical protein